MFMVVDSGSTKADWMIIHEDGKQSTFSTRGINPVFHDEGYILEQLRSSFLPALAAEAIERIFFYGSGCWDDERKNIVRTALTGFFPNAESSVQHDLEGAARATCGDQAGIACILGTGSNSCLFDGSRVVDNVTNLGYLLGDEGSGTHLGKYLARAYFYREIPDDLRQIFDRQFPGGKKEILDRVYGGEAPNVYLASLAKLLAAQQDHPYIRGLVRRSFSEFIDRHVVKYTGFRELPIHFVGSIAYHFSDILEELLRRRALQVGRIMRKPIEALVSYHLQQTT